MSLYLIAELGARVIFVCNLYLTVCFPEDETTSLDRR